MAHRHWAPACARREGLGVGGLHKPFATHFAVVWPQVPLWYVHLSESWALVFIMVHRRLSDRSFKLPESRPGSSALPPPPLWLVSGHLNSCGGRGLPAAGVMCLKQLCEDFRLVTMGQCPCCVLLEGNIVIHLWVLPRHTAGVRAGPGSLLVETRVLPVQSESSDVWKEAAQRAVGLGAGGRPSLG